MAPNLGEHRGSVLEYSPYNSEILAKLLDIYRVYYNFVKPGRDKQTPAQRIGLCDRAVPIHDISRLI